MQDSSLQTQDQPRTSQVNIRLTANEKEDLKLVSGFDRIPEADLIRRILLDISARAEDIRNGRAISLAA